MTTTNEIVYYSIEDAKLCRDHLGRRGFSASITPRPICRIRQSNRGTLEAFEQMLGRAETSPDRFSDEESYGLIQAELTDTRRIIERTRTLVESFFVTHPAGSTIIGPVQDHDALIIPETGNTGYIRELLEDNGILSEKDETGKQTVLRHLPIAELRLERPSIGLETIAPELLIESGILSVTETGVEYRFVVTSDADAQTRARCRGFIGIVDTISPAGDSPENRENMQQVRERVMHIIQTSAGDSSRHVTGLKRMLETPHDTGDGQLECYTLPDEFLRDLLHERELFDLE